MIDSDEFLSDTKNYKHHPESFYTSHLLNESIEQAESLNLSSAEIGSKAYYINDSIKEKEKINKLAEAKQQEIINSDKFPSDAKNYKQYTKSPYASHLLDELQKAETSN